MNKVLDIEENLCCPELGLKGKIDATLEVTIHDRKGINKHIFMLGVVTLVFYIKKVVISFYDIFNI